MPQHSYRNVLHAVGLLTFIFIKYCVVCCPMGGLIWNSTAEEFVSISSINMFLQIDNISGKTCQSLDSDLEIYNFNGESIRIVGYEQRSVLLFYDNNTQITGIWGDIWTLLSHYLNFKMILTKLEESVFTIDKTNHGNILNFTYMHGNTTDIFLPLHIFRSRLNDMDFTEPIYKQYYRLYIERKSKIDKTWLFKLFNRDVWIIILIIFVVFVSVSYISQKLSAWILKTRKKNVPPKDHLFYNFARICNQGYVPLDFECSRILGISMSMFASVILIAYGSQLISHMTQKSYIPPFTDLDTLYADTTYNLIGFKDSIIDGAYQLHSRKIYRSIIKDNRISFINDSTAEIQSTCSKANKIAIYKSNDAPLTGNCKMVPIGEKYYESWMVAGLTKGYKYRNVINTGIKKIRETGFLDILMTRWTQSQVVQHNSFEFISVTMDHVEIIFLILIYGMIISLIILVIENIRFFAKYW